MAAGLLIPLEVVGVILRATGHPLTGITGFNWVPVIWLAVGGVLAIWTGMMARSMYAPKRNPA
jgi:hypothetical protein